MQVPPRILSKVTNQCELTEYMWFRLWLRSKGEQLHVDRVNSREISFIY